MSRLLSSCRSSTAMGLVVGGAILTTTLLAGCDAPDSVSVSRNPDGKVNVTSTYVDVSTRVAPVRADDESPTERSSSAGASKSEPAAATPEEPETVPAASGESLNEETAAGSRDETRARVFSSSRAPALPGEAEKISFDDLVIGLQADVVFRPWMMGDRPKELDGKKVRISGFMHAGAEPVKTKEFVLLRNLECKFGPGGQADHLAQVYMKPGITTHYPGKDPIKVEGTLKIEPFEGTDGNTWSLYKIVDADVVR